ncbi:MAG TPA: DNA-processing protein DprA [Candidatus Hydrogenedentes bacterium]|nr:DNA-processing protein DprA [Candidatus Hydrogenedentota bacterium]
MDRYTPADILALKLVPGAGNVSLRLILTCLRQQKSRLRSLLGKPLPELLPLFPCGQERLAELIHACDARMRKRAVSLLQTLEKHAIIPILSGTPAYPAALETHLGKNAPLLFFAKGNLALLYQEAIGIVGTRMPSQKGTRITQECARMFAEHGIPIVSGGARGVDTFAHEAALEAGGDTLIVLPQGILTYSPSSRYAAALSDGKLLLISEFSPDAEWQTHAAVTRNATISALARMILVIEPHSVNGSLRTARHALEQGKSVFYHGLGTAAQPLARHPNTVPLSPVNSQILLSTFHQPGASFPNQSCLF